MPPVPLLQARRFLPLFVTQFLGALNDNLFKNALGVHGPVCLRPARQRAGGGRARLFSSCPMCCSPRSPANSPTAARNPRLIRLTKLWELGLMAVGAAGFLTASLPLLMAVLFGLGIQATFFSPLKYGILPDHLAETELVAGNGLIEAGTFLGILAGTIAGSALVRAPHGPLIVAGLGLLVALAGLAASWRIPPRRGRRAWAAHRLEHPARDRRPDPRRPRPSRRLAVRARHFVVLGGRCHRAVGTAGGGEGRARRRCRADHPAAGGVLGRHRRRLGRLRAAAARRCLAAAGALRRAGDFPVHLRSCRAFAAAGHLAAPAEVLAAPAGWRILADLFALALCGGVYSVSLYAFIQDRADPASRSRMIAMNNVLNAAAMVAASAVAAGLAVAHVSAPRILLLTAAANTLAAVWILRILPRTTLRALAAWYFRRFHRAEITGLEHYRAAGPRLVMVVNHVSLADGVLVAAFLPDAPAFAIYTLMARKWWVKPFIAPVDSFLVDPTRPLAARAMIDWVRQDRRLVIFPEGRLSRTGALMKVYDGAALIADRAGAELLPIRIDGPQFSPFGRMGGRVPAPLVRAGAPQHRPAGAARRRPGAARPRPPRRCSPPRCRTSWSTPPSPPPTPAAALFSALLRARDRHGAALEIAEDIARAPLTYRRLLLGAVVLGRRLDALVPPGERVGVMLPNANATLMTFFGAAGLRAGARPAEFFRRRRRHAFGLPCRAGVHHRHLARLHRARADGAQHRPDGAQACA